MAENPSEAVIVRGLRNGDPDAWEALCRLYSVRLWAYVARLIGSDEGAVGDVFQETMLAVAKSGRNLATDSRLWAWLATIGHNQCALYWRRQKQRLDLISGDESAIPGVTPEDQLERRETAATVRLVMAEMSPQYAMVLTAKYTDKLSIAEIASGSGESAEAIRSRLARARRDFRQRYETLTAETAGQIPD